MSGSRVRVVGRRRLLAWLAAWCLIVAAQLLASLVPGERTLWVSPLGLFILVVVAATACAVAAAVVIVIGWREGTAELAVIGSFAMAVSLLPLVHGITTPGVWYGPNDACEDALPPATVASTRSPAGLGLSPRT